MHISANESGYSKDIYITDVEIIDTRKLPITSNNIETYKPNSVSLLDKIFEKIISYIDHLCVGDTCINKASP